MLNGKYVSIETAIEKAQVIISGLNASLDFGESLEWSGEALMKIGAPRQWTDRVTDGNLELGHPNHVALVDHRGELPKDIYQIVQVRDCSTKLPLRRTTDTFHSAYECSDSNDFHCNECEHTYKVNENFIFTSLETGELEIAYRAIPVDDRGFPLIPDNHAYLEAVKSYLLMRTMERLWLESKVSKDKFEHYQQEWLWYVNAAESRARIPNYDAATSWKNIMIRLIPNINEDISNNFRHLGSQEKRYNNGTHNQ